MLGYMSVAAGFCLVLGVAMWLFGRARRFVVVCALVVGAGASGWAGHLLASAGGAIGSASDTIGGKLFGVGLAGGLAAALIAWVWIALRSGKGGGAGKGAGGGRGGGARFAATLLKWTPVAALLLPALLPALWGALSEVPELSGLTGSLREFAASFTTAR